MITDVKQSVICVSYADSGAVVAVVIVLVVAAAVVVAEAATMVSVAIV